MADEIKAVSEPAEKVAEDVAPQKTPGEALDESYNSLSERHALEDSLVKANQEISTPVQEAPKEAEEVKPPDDPMDKIKKSIQKRIDKEVAKRKTAEEELAELRAENERLKSLKQEPKPEEAKREPTDAEIRAALKKAREDGDVDFEAQILEYMTERKANRIADERIKKIEDERKAAESRALKQKADVDALVRDYTVYDKDGKPDLSHELSLANPKGLLRLTAEKLFSDPELKKDYYSDPDQVAAYRRAVADAEREIYRLELYKPKREEVIVPRKPNPKSELAIPDADGVEETSTPRKELSDAEKVQQEIRARRKFQDSRIFY